MVDAVDHGCAMLFCGIIVVGGLLGATIAAGFYFYVQFAGKQAMIEIAKNIPY